MVNGYDQRREDLEQLLKDEPAKEQELRVYDLMVSARKEFEEANPANYANFLPAIYKTIEDRFGKLDHDMKRQIVQNVSDYLPEPEEGPGYIVALNFDPSLKDELANGNYSMDVVGKSIMDPSIDSQFKDVLGRRDKAIIVNKDGTIYGVQVYLNDANVKKIMPHLENITSYDLGFAEPVNARQFSSIAMSGQTPMTVYTMSQTNGHIRRFKDGCITFSTHPDEPQNVMMCRSEPSETDYRITA
jgi:hypothetical protein